MTLALILFFVTYALMLIFSNLRPWIALSSAALFVILGILPLGEVPGAVDWNVILMIGGTMGTVSFFIDSKMPNLLSDLIIEKSPNLKMTTVWLSVFAGVISAFVDNVATVLMIAPVALVAAKKLKVSPVPILISIAVSSNLQGAATLVGDTTSILLGGYANMNFLDFFWYKGAPGMFFVVEAGAFASVLILLWLFRKETGKVEAGTRTEVKDTFPTVLMAATVLLLIAASFFPDRPAMTNGFICAGVFVIGLIRELICRNTERVKTAFREFDYQTLLLLIGLFVVIAGITKAGVIDAIASLFVKIGGSSMFLTYTIIVWASVVFSAFIDNIPYVATMLPVTAGIASAMGADPTILFFGLLAGATLGGNLSPIGASANITAIGMLRKSGYEVKNRDFLRIGVPFTLAAVLCGYVLIWVFWA